jgi:hypothetical protein
MPSNLFSLPRLILPFVICLSFLGNAEPAGAKLGESFQTYRAKILKSWRQEAEDVNGPKTNYRFSLIVAPEQESASPGYAAGLTITVVNGKVTGQSMAIRPGSNQMVGAAMATAHGFAFAYEALGKPMPADKAKSEEEFKNFSGAVGQAFTGRSQGLKFPGFSGLITVTRDNLGDLIVAATPAPAAGGPTGK